MLDIDENAKKSVEALAILEFAAADTPTFLRGVLLTPGQANHLAHLIEQLNRDEVDATKYWDDVRQSIKDGERFIGDILVGALRGEDLKDTAIRAMSKKGQQS